MKLDKKLLNIIKTKVVVENPLDNGALGGLGEPRGHKNHKNLCFLIPSSSTLLALKGCCAVVSTSGAQSKSSRYTLTKFYSNVRQAPKCQADTQIPGKHPKYKASTQCQARTQDQASIQHATMPQNILQFHPVVSEFWKYVTKAPKDARLPASSGKLVLRVR